MIYVYIGIGVFILFFVGAGVFLFKLKSNVEKEVSSDEGNKDVNNELAPTNFSSKTTHSVLPFKDIRDSMIYLGQDEYRMIIECSSVNLDLKTAEEQEIVELQFQRFIQSLNGPFTFYIQTREINNDEIVSKTREDAIETIRKFPFMREYAEDYLYELNNLKNTLNNTKMKKKYVIISFNDTAKMKNLSDAEKWEIAFNELDTKARTVIYGLRNVGIEAQVLDSNGIAEVIFRAYNKNLASSIDGVLDGEMTSMVVDGKRHLATLDVSEEYDLAILEFFNQLELIVLQNENSPEVFKEAAKETIDIVNKLRDNVGGVYKRYSTSENEDYKEHLNRILNKDKKQESQKEEDEDDFFVL